MIESSCVYLIAEGKWLMLCRDRKENDLNHGRWIGIGGKRERNETMEQCARREVLEESGLVLDSLEKRGTVLFLYDGKNEERIIVYTSHDFHGVMHSNPEGSMQWIEERNILRLNLWEGDRIFLKKILHGEKELFNLVLEYDSEGNLIAERENIEL